MQEVRICREMIDTLKVSSRFDEGVGGDEQVTLASSAKNEVEEKHGRATISSGGVDGRVMAPTFGPQWVSWSWIERGCRTG